MTLPFIIYANDTGLDLYLQFDDLDDSRLPFTEGIGDQLRRYEVTEAEVDELELADGIYHPSVRLGDIDYPTDLDEIIDAFELVLPVPLTQTPIVEEIWEYAERTLTSGNSGDSGGGILSARIGIVSLTSQDFLEIVQGEQKVITFIVEAHGRFVTNVFTDLVVKIKDSAGTVIEKTEDDYETSIVRICQELDVQVLRCTLSEDDTALLVAGLTQIEIAFDNQKARLTHSVKILDQIIVEGS